MANQIGFDDHNASDLFRTKWAARWTARYFHLSSGEGVLLYGDVPLDRVWFFGLNRVNNLTCLYPKPGQNLSYTSRETLT